MSGLTSLVFLGSVRESTPPRPSRIGARVAAYCLSSLVSRGIEAALVDPLAIPRPATFKPHFAYSKPTCPSMLDELAQDIAKADMYVMVTPEYNHSFSPALGDLLNHFGSSLFSYKPSIIVSYSAGQWGGTRAAIALRPFLSELGCLPVSQMIHFPRAPQVLDENGRLKDDQDEDRWNEYVGRGWAQLEWWAQAAKNNRISHDPFVKAKAFNKNPGQRNAP